MRQQKHEPNFRYCSNAKQVNLNIAPRKVFLPFAIDKIYVASKWPVVFINNVSVYFN